MEKANCRIGFKSGKEITISTDPEALAQKVFDTLSASAVTTDGRWRWYRAGAFIIDVFDISYVMPVPVSDAPPEARTVTVVSRANGQ